MLSLNPVQRVGDQIAEQIRAHDDSVDRAQGRELAVGGRRGNLAAEPFIVT